MTPPNCASYLPRTTSVTEAAARTRNETLPSRHRGTASELHREAHYLPGSSSCSGTTLPDDAASDAAASDAAAAADAE